MLGGCGGNVNTDKSDFDAKETLKMILHRFSVTQVCLCSPLKHYFEAHSSA